MLVPYCFDYCSLKSGYVTHPTLFFFLKIALLIWGLLWFHMNFRTFFISIKFVIGIFFFLAVLGLLCCTRAFSSRGEQGLLFVAVCRLLILVPSLVAEHGL